jgi:hypothetical protein
MNLYRKFFLCGLVVFFVGITLCLSSAQLAANQPITPKGVVINFAQREMQASPQIRGVLQTLRQDIAARRLTFEVGYTAALDFRIEQLAGLAVPANFAQLVPAQNAAARQIAHRLQLRLAQSLWRNCGQRSGSMRQLLGLCDRWSL